MITDKIKELAEEWVRSKDLPVLQSMFGSIHMRESDYILAYEAGFQASESLHKERVERLERALKNAEAALQECVSRLDNDFGESLVGLALPNTKESLSKIRTLLGSNGAEATSDTVGEK